MGCDMHLHIEVKLDGKWEHRGNPSIRRDYRMFAKMVGVRQSDKNPSTSISSPNGLPSDLTRATQYEVDYEGADGHDHSWFNLQQIKQLTDWYGETYSPETHPFGLEGVVGYFLGNDWSLSKYHPRITDIRFVFWFDN